MTNYNNEKRYVRINQVLAVVVVLFLVVAVAGVYKTIDSYEKNGIGALIDAQHQKYQQEQAHEVQVAPNGATMVIPKNLDPMSYSMQAQQAYQKMLGQGQHKADIKVIESIGSEGFKRQ